MIFCFSQKSFFLGSDYSDYLDVTGTVKTKNRYYTFTFIAEADRRKIFIGFEKSVCDPVRGTELTYYLALWVDKIEW